MRFRFGTRTLFVLMTLIAIWLGWRLNQLKRRTLALHDIRHHVGSLVRVDLRERFAAVPNWADWLICQEEASRVQSIYWMSNIGDDDLRLVGAHSQIESLELYDTHITDAGLANLKSLSELHSLKIFGAEITGDGLKHLAELPQLKNVAIASSPLTDSASKYFTLLPRLSNLSLWETHMTDASIGRLGNLKDIQSLTIGASRVTIA